MKNNDFLSIRFNQFFINLHQIIATSWIKSSQYSTFCGRIGGSFSSKWSSFRNVDPLFGTPDFFQEFTHFVSVFTLKRSFFMLSRRAKSGVILSNYAHFFSLYTHPQNTTSSPDGLRPSPPEWCSRGECAATSNEWDPPTASQRAPPGGAWDVVRSSPHLMWRSLVGFGHTSLTPLAHMRGDDPPSFLGLDLVTWVCFANAFGTPTEPGGAWQVGFVPHPTCHVAFAHEGVPVVGSLRGLRPLRYPLLSPLHFAHMRRDYWVICCVFGVIACNCVESL